VRIKLSTLPYKELHTIRPDCKTHSLLFLLNKGFNFPALLQLQHRKPHNARNQCYKAAAGEKKRNRTRKPKNSQRLKKKDRKERGNYTSKRIQIPNIISSTSRNRKSDVVVKGVCSRKQARRTRKKNEKVKKQRSRSSRKGDK
jgi:hypothetical protein